jgi:phosphoglycerate dehydrogenase-like enzyme
VLAAATPNVHALVAARLPPDVELRVAEPGGIDGVDFLVLQSVELLGELASHRELRAVQVLSAGTDWVEQHVPPWAALCNARGTRDVPVAEWVVGALLGWTSGLLAGARRRTWADVQPVELFGATVVILGHGSIGAAVAARLAPFGVRCVGVGRRELGQLPELLATCDALVVLAPLTPQSRGMVDAAMLAALPDGALVANAGRGPVVDTDALVAELRSGRLEAVLDVVDPEPLADGHPLWDLALTITPHHAGDTVPADERAADLAAAQLLRHRRDQPLVNVVLAAGR